MPITRWKMPVVALVLALVSVASMQPAHAQTAHPGWCAPELESLSDSVCYVSPSGKSQTLVIFLHPLVGVGSNWQWDQQRWFARLARSLGFSVLMPRGRAGIGPGRSQDIYAWPTSQKMQEQHEDAIIAEWMQSKRVLEQRQGRFERVLVFGFSNGAYYAASLALRGRLPVDGYGVFAGGSGAMSRRLRPTKVEAQAPIFVGFGTKDPARRDQQELIKTLRKLAWKHRSLAARVGHTVTESQLRAALQFLAEPPSRAQENSSSAK